MHLFRISYFTHILLKLFCSLLYKSFKRRNCFVERSSPDAEHFDPTNHVIFSAVGDLQMTMLQTSRALGTVIKDDQVALNAMEKITSQRKVKFIYFEKTTTIYRNLHNFYLILLSDCKNNLSYYLLQ